MDDPTEFIASLLLAVSCVVALLVIIYEDEDFDP